MALRELNSIDTIYIHCSATPEGKNVTVQEIDSWHKARGWSGIGYHFFVDLQGKIHIGRSLNRVGAHVKNHNVTSIGICYAGGVDEQNEPKDTLNKKQYMAIKNLIMSLGTVFQKSLNIKGHNEVSPKACPSFNVKEKFGKEQLLLDLLYSAPAAI